MHPSPRPLRLIATLLALAAFVAESGCRHQPVRPTPSPTVSRPTPTASIAVGAGWLDVKFPPIPIAELGCRSAGLGDSVHYAWGTVRNFSDAQPPHGHNISIVATFRLPGGTRLTEARFDSALAAAEFRVGEYPAYVGPKEPYSPARASVRREADHVRLRIEDHSAVSDFLRPEVDRAAVVWCQRDSGHGFVIVPIERH